MLCLPATGFVVVDASPDIERLDELALVVEKVDWPILQLDTVWVGGHQDSMPDQLKDRPSSNVGAAIVRKTR
jgi:hypothetical protein